MINKSYSLVNEGYMVLRPELDIPSLSRRLSGPVELRSRAALQLANRFTAHIGQTELAPRCAGTKYLACHKSMFRP